MKYFIKIFLILHSCLLFPQQINEIKIHTPEGVGTIPAYYREGTAYISAALLAEKISVDYIRNKDESIILRGGSYDMLIKAKNSFYVISSKNGNVVRVFQVPTSTYIISDDIFVPLLYSIDILNQTLDTELEYDDQRKLIVSFHESPYTDDPLPEKTKYDISDINVEVKANGTLVKLTSGKEIRFYNSDYADGILSIILRGVDIDPSLANKIAASGLIQKMEINNIGRDSEIKIHVGSDYSASEILKLEGTNNLLITIHNKVFSKDNDKIKDKWDFDVIVIDPGHGGRDAGAVGINGIKEKEINLAIGLKLGKLINEKMPGVKVVYTRDNDKFVELYMRGRIANENDGKLFISIHCNSTENRNSTASGFEVFLLRPGRTQEAIAIAERENSVIEYEDDPRRYQQLTDENFILVSMAHSAYMKYSEKFSEYLDKHFTSSFRLPNRGVKQAGFYVLVGASMPGVLVEAGFLSNKNDAAFLTSDRGQEQTAELIFQSVKSYKSYYESFLGAQ